MKKLYLFVLIVFIALGCNAQTATEQADKLLNDAIPNKEHALSVLVAKDGNIIYEKVLGYADVAHKREADQNTIFRIGSVTKQFTASAILKLVEEGKLSLEDHLSMYIKDFPKGDKVTIHQLLTHTSGIKSYTDEHDFIKQVKKPVKTEELVDQIKTLGYGFEPGDQWKYSNSGYYILGFLIEKVSGKPYGLFLEDNFFDPLKMNHSGVYENNKNYGNEALGYMAEKGKIKRSLHWDMTWAGGAGNLYSTARDLYTWNKGVFSNEVIGREYLKKAHTKVRLNDGSNYPYGYGWALGNFRGLQSIGHSGGLHGFLSNLVHYPEIDATIVVLSNASPPLNVVPANFSNQLAQIFFKDFLKGSKEIEAHPANYPMYAGLYEYPGGAIMKVSVEDDKLYAQLANQPKFEIYPKGERQFFWKVVDAEITFHVKDGKVGYATHKQNGSETKVPKIEAQHEVEMSSKKFKKYAGEYALNGASVKVWEEDGGFYTQIEGQPKFQIYAKGGDEFFMKEMAVNIKFNVPGDQAESLTIFQNGKEFLAPRKE